MVIPANKKAGRPSHEPDDVRRSTVMAMAGYGIPEADIAKVIRIDPKTLRKHYRDELDTGHIRANTRVAQSLYELATTGNVTAAIWWTKARMGWRETNRDAPEPETDRGLSEESVVEIRRGILGIR